MDIDEILDAFKGYWYENYTTTPTLWENYTLTDEEKKSPFVMFEVEGGASKTVGSGSPLQGVKTRYTGMVVVTVNVPNGTGTKTAYSIAKEAISLLEHRRIETSLAMYAGAILDTDTDGEHFQVIVGVPFKTTIG